MARATKWRVRLQGSDEPSEFDNGDGAYTLGGAGDMLDRALTIMAFDAAFDGAETAPEVASVEFVFNDGRVCARPDCRPCKAFSEAAPRILRLRFDQMAHSLWA